MDSRHAVAAEALVEDLKQLRIEVGNPSLGRLAQLSGGQLSKSTLDDHLARRRVRLPPWHLVASYVTACHQAAASTGLDVERLGSLKDWHGRYLAALEGDAYVQCPIDRESTSRHSGTQGGRNHDARTKVTTRLRQSARPAFIKDQRSQDLDQLTVGESTQFPGDRRILGEPAINNRDDELEVSAQGASKWVVRWLPSKPAMSEASPDMSPQDEESTESLLSSHEVAPEDQADLALYLAADTGLLLVKRGPYAGSQFVLDQDRTTIGRDPTCDVFLDDATVSRTHSIIYRQKGQFRIRDVGSLNGTYVDRRLITEDSLASGNELQIGVFRFLFLQSY